MTLVPVHLGHNWGYVDPIRGKLAIPPRYDCACPFSEGLAAVSVGGNQQADPPLPSAWGYIDESGEWAVQARFDDAFSFRDGIALVSYGASIQYIAREDAYYNLGSEYGFINRTGNWALEKQYTLAKGFSEGVASVSKYGESSYIDRSGAIRIPGPFYYADRFSHGLAAVATDNFKQWGYIDHDGIMVIPQIWSLAHPFSEGLAMVLRKSDYHYFFLNEQGEVAVEAPVGTIQAGSFSNGVAWMQTGEIGTFNDGSGCYGRSKPHGFGLIDRSGRWVVEPQFDDANAFSEGLSVVTAGNKKGFMRADGSWLVEPKYDWATSFCEGFAAVTEGFQTKVITRDGETVWSR